MSRLDFTHESTLSIIDSTGRAEACTVRYSHSPPWHLEFDFDSGVNRFSGPDLFECLTSLRRSLEDRGLFILCNGARTDAWATAMSRQMSGGKKVYILRIGEQQNLRSLVGTFEPTSAEHVGTVTQQRAYFEAWTRSIGMRISDS